MAQSNITNGNTVNAFNGVAYCEAVYPPGASIQQNDWMYAIIGVTGGLGETVTPNEAGWTPVLEQDNSTAIKLIVFKKKASGGEVYPNKEKFSFTGARSSICFVSVWRGQSAGTPIHASSKATDSGTTHDTPAVTTSITTKPFYIAVADVGGSYSNATFGALLDKPGGSMMGIIGTNLEVAAPTIAAESVLASQSGNACVACLAMAEDSPPGAPGTPTVTGDVSGSTSDFTATINWTAATDPEQSAGELKYRGEYSTNGTNWFSLFGYTALGATSAAVNVRNFAAGTTYRVRVIANDGNSDGTPSSSSSQFTIQHAPSAPAWVSPAAGSTHTIGRNKTLDWAASSDPDTAVSSIIYHLEISTAGSGGPYSAVTGSPTSAGVTDLVYDFAGKSPNSNTYIRVWGNDGVLNGNKTTVGPFTLAADATPSAPAPVTFEQGGVAVTDAFNRAGALTVKWVFNDPGDIQQDYEVDWGTDGATFPNSSGTVTDDAEEHEFTAGTFSGVADGTTVYFRVRTRDAGNNWSGYEQQTIKASILGVVTITDPADEGTVGESRPTYTWTFTKTQAARQVETREPDDDVILTEDIVVSATTSQQITPNLQEGNSYRAAVRAKDSNGLWSDWAVNDFTVVFDAPAIPTIAVTPETANGRTVIAITDPTPTGGQPDVTSHNLYAIDPDGNVAYLGASASTTMYDYRAASGVEYLYYVEAYADSGEFSTSSQVAGTLTLLSLWVAPYDDLASAFDLFAVSIGHNGSLGGEDVTLDARKYNATIYDGSKKKVYRYGILTKESTTRRADIEDLHDSATTILMRDAYGNKAYSSMRDQSAGYEFVRVDFVLEFNQVLETVLYEAA